MYKSRKVIPAQVPITDAYTAKLEPITFIEARRLKGSIYAALMKELKEEGCKRGAALIEKFACRENKLYADRSIRSRIYDDKVLLMAFFENMKMAETGILLKTSCGYKMAYKCFYELLLLLDKHQEEVAWMMEDVFFVVAAACENLEQIDTVNMDEILARIYYRSAYFFGLKDENLQPAIKYMEKVVKLSKQEYWISEMDIGEFGIYPSMHLQSGRNLVSFLLRFAENISNDDPESATEYAYKAILTLSEINLEKNKMQYYQASVMYAKFSMMSKQYKQAHKILRQLSEDMTTLLNNIISPTIISELCIQEGTCLLSLGQRDAAIAKYKEALQVSHDNDLKEIEAEVCLVLALTHMEQKDDRSLNLARIALMRAKVLYIELEDEVSLEKTHWLLGKLKCYGLFPHLLATIKLSKSQPCSLVHFRDWKYRGTPFEEIKGLQKIFEEEFTIDCLIKDQVQVTVKRKHRKA